MPRKARELSPLEVRRMVTPGRWSVGGVDGLALQVSASGARSWVLRVTVAGRQREMGLGSFPSVPLAGGARTRAHAARQGRSRYRPHLGANRAAKLRRCRAQRATDILHRRRSVHRAAREGMEERQARSPVDSDAQGLRRAPSSDRCWSGM